MAITHIGHGEHVGVSAWESSTGSPGYISREDYVSNNTGSSVSNIWGDNYVANTFTTPSSGMSLGFIALYFLTPVGSPNDMRGSIQAVDGSGHPDNTEIAFVIRPAADIAAGLNIFWFDTPVTLSASTKYAMVFSQDADGGDGSNYYPVYYSTTSQIANGNRESTLDGGSTWSSEANHDYRCRAGWAPISGNFMLDIDTTGGASTKYVEMGTGDYDYTVVFDICILQYPSSDAVIIGDSGGAQDQHITLKTTGALELRNASGQIGTDSSVLALNTWYRVAAVSENAGTAILRVDGTVEATGSHAGNDQFMHRVGFSTSVTGHVLFDNIVFNSDNYTTNNDPAEYKIAAARPRAFGTYQNFGVNQWQRRYASSDYTTNPVLSEFRGTEWEVAGTSNGAWEEANSTAHRLSFTLDNCGVSDLKQIGGEDIINAVQFEWYYATGGGGVSEYWKLIIDESTDQEVAIDDPKDPTWLRDLDLVTPKDSDAWTQTHVDNLEVGMMCDDANKDLWFYEVYAVVVFTPAEGVSLQGSVVVAATTTGRLEGGDILRGSLTASSTTTGSLSVETELAGSVSATSSVTTADLIKEVSLQTIDPHIVERWKCEDSDASTTVVGERGQDATAQQNTDQITTTGAIGNGFTQNGSSDYQNTGSPWQDVFRGPYSLSIWIKPDDGRPSTIEFILGVADYTGDNSYANLNLRTDGSLDWTYHSEGNEGTSCRAVDLFDDGPAAGWTHIVVTGDPSVNGRHGHKLFINGIQQLHQFGYGDTTGVNFAEFAVAQNLYFGANNGNGVAEGWFAGDLDDFIIFDRVLNESEVAWLYNSGSGRTGDFPLAATSVVRGEVSLLKGLQGTAAATATTTGSLSQEHSIAGSSTTTSVTTGSLDSQPGLVGSIVAANPGTTCELTKILGFTLLDPDPIVATATTTGALSVETELAGTVSATSTTAPADLDSQPGLTGEAAATVTVTSPMGVIIGLAGTVSATVTSVGDVDVTTGLQGEVVVTATPSGDLTAEFELAGQVSATATPTGDIDVGTYIGGVVSATVTTTGDLTSEISIQGSISVVSTTDPADLDSQPGLGGQVSVTVTPSGDLTAEFELAGQVSVTVTSSGDLDVETGLQGSIVATSSVPAINLDSQPGLVATISVVAIVDQPTLETITEIYSRGQVLYADDSDEATPFDETDYADVLTDNAVRVSQDGNANPAVFVFKNKFEAEDNIALTWNGQSDVAPSDSPLKLEIWNITDTQWELLDSDSVGAANTDVTLQGTQQTDLDKYFDPYSWVTARVYQEAFFD
jgi:hypothetical protein